MKKIKKWLTEKDIESERQAIELFFQLFGYSKTNFKYYTSTRHMKDIKKVLTDL